jgi:hypothetical protein
MDLVTIFCDLDDFCRYLLDSEQRLLPVPSGRPQGRRSSRLALSEVMTILV